MEEFTTNDTNSMNINENDDISFMDISDILGKNKIIYREECYKIYGAIYEVHNCLGSGFLESVYQEALEIELNKLNIPFESQKMIQIDYKGKILTQYFKSDLICYDKILLELKAVSKITNEHKAQLLNYLTATKIKLGLLVNFGTFPKAEICRIAL